MTTRSKRASSVGILLPFVLSPVLADGTLAVGDRQHIAFSYSGIDTTAVVHPDTIIVVRSDVGTIRVRPDVGTISVRPDVGSVEV